MRCGPACSPSQPRRRSSELWRPVVHPGSDGRSISLNPQHGSSCTMDQNLAQIDVAPLADAEQLRLASGGILPWHDAKPCCEVSPLTKGSSVADSRDDGCCHDRSDAWDLTDASATRVCSGDPFQLMVSSSICCSTVFHSLHSRSIRLRICGVRSASAFSRTSGIAPAASLESSQTPCLVRAGMHAAG